MKILTILTYYAPHWTGLTAHAVRVAEGLAGRGHEVTVLTTRHDPDLATEAWIHGVRVVRLDAVARFSRGMITPAFPAVAARLIGASDVVQIHTPLPEALLVAGLCRARGTPLLMTHHGDVVMPGGPAGRALQELAFGILKGTTLLSDRVTSYSRDYAEHSRLLRPVMHKLDTVFPPVEIPAPDPAGMAAWKAELGLADRRLVGIAGRWVDEKGFRYLLEAMPIVRERIPEAHLIFAGERRIVYEDTYERDRPLIDAQREHVTFVGLLHGADTMARFYGMLDVFALPSKTDMLAITQVEALLCGTPVVASDIPGARVVVRDTGYGRLVPPRDPRALAEALVEVMSRPERYAPTQEGVRRLFGTERSLDRYEAALTRAIEARHGAAVALEEGRPPRLFAAPGVPLVRHRGNGRPHRSLSASDDALLDRWLVDEPDTSLPRRARPLLDFLDLQDGQRVLDCGCGMGFYLQLMGRLRDVALVGLDRDARRLAQAREAGVSAALVEGDILSLPFPDGHFDRVLMSEVLEHLPDDRAALAEVYRVLRPGGVLALSVPHADYPLLWDPINKLWTALGGAPIRRGPLVGIWTNHERLYRPAALVEVARGAGFTVDVVEEATHFSFPFAHFLVYGVGKPLLERGLLPDDVSARAGRFRGAEAAGDGGAGGGARPPVGPDPLRLGLAAFRAFDRLNDRPQVAGKRTFVNVLMRARKPAG